MFCLPPHDVSGYLHACDSKLVEIDAHACGTPRRNRPGWKVLDQDIQRDLLGGLIHEYELAASAESDRVSRHPAVVRRATGGS
jgi:hypothetical protein